MLIVVGFVIVISASPVGTFPGVLMSYGFVAPLAGSLEQRVNEEQYYRLCIKAGLCQDSSGNWELSADRASAARRAMWDSGLRPDQVDTVRGYKDRRPRVADDPLDTRSHRIWMVVHNS